MQLFLTSSNSLVSADIAQKIQTQGKKLVFIETAAEIEEGDKQWLQDDRQALVDVGFEVTNYTLAGKTQDQVRAVLTPTDVIYVSGGNTFYLLEQAQKSGSIALIQELVREQGKTYIGSSAGSLLAAPTIYPAIRLDDADLAPGLQGYESLGLVNFIIFPHWGSPHFKELYLNKRLDHSYRIDQIPIIILTDTQYVWVKDDTYQIVEVRGKR